MGIERTGGLGNPTILAQRVAELRELYNIRPPTPAQEVAQRPLAQRAQPSERTLTAAVGELDVAYGVLTRLGVNQRLAMNVTQAVNQAFGNPAIKGIFGELYAARLPGTPSSQIPHAPTTFEAPRQASLYAEDPLAGIARTVLRNRFPG